MKLFILSHTHTICSHHSMALAMQKNAKLKYSWQNRMISSVKCSIGKIEVGEMGTGALVPTYKPLWPPLPQFSQLWMNTPTGLHCSCSLSCEGVPPLASTAFVHLAVNEYLHCSCSLSCEWVPPLASTTLVHSAVNCHCPGTLSCEPVLSLASIAPFTQLWTSAVPSLYCSIDCCEPVLSLASTAPFTQLWTSIVPSLYCSIDSAVNQYCP